MVRRQTKQPQQKWPADSVKRWPLDDIKPYPNNPRTHPAAQIALLAEHLRRFGPDQPIVVDEFGVILKGHGRLSAAREAGLKEFPVVQRIGLSDADKSALRIADNQIALLSEWDMPLLQAEMAELSLADYDMPLLGLDESTLALPDDSSTETTPTAAPPAVDPFGDNLVAFAFGDYKARISRAIYTAFISAVESEKLKGNFSLDSVLRSWMPK